jgi:GNAT superfamily N-acetyltransferase
MGISEECTIRPFRAEDQEAAKQLVIDGLGERWGWIDLSLNPDLNDIATTYAEGTFLVGHLGDALVVTGALLPEVTPEGIHALRVVRMSVRADLRGHGIGRRMLDALLEVARAENCSLILVETTSSWTDAVRFYARNDFQFVDERDGETHMILEIGKGQ